MTTRPLQESDIAEIHKLYLSQGFDYEFPDLRGPRMEMLRVVEEDGAIVAIIALERILQAYLWCDKMSPTKMQKLGGVLYSDLVGDIRKLGYDGVTAFLPPQIDRRFGNFLRRRFGFVKSWNAWGKCF